jgi:hypothetical protein
MVGLSREDFTVVDRGHPQEIAVFGKESQPRAVVIMLDYSGSMAQHKRAITEAAQRLVGRLLPIDRARVGSFGTAGLPLDPADDGE